MPPAARPTPPGFYAIALCAGCFAALMAWALFELGGRFQLPWQASALRGATAVLAALAAVAAEALWNAQPWAYRASAALALAYALVVGTLGLSSGSTGVMGALTLLGVSSLGIVPALLYVRKESRRLFGLAARLRPPPRRVPAPPPLVHRPHP